MEITRRFTGPADNSGGGGGGGGSHYAPTPSFSFVFVSFLFYLPPLVTEFRPTGALHLAGPRPRVEFDPVFFLFCFFRFARFPLAIGFLFCFFFSSATAPTVAIVFDAFTGFSLVQNEFNLVLLAFT